MRLLVYIYCFFIVAFGYAQNVQTKDFNLDWKDNVDVILNSNRQINIPVVNNNLIDENGIPLYTNSFNVEKNAILHNYSLKNVKFEILPKKYSTGLTTKYIPNELKSNFNFGHTKNNSKGILKMTPLIIVGNEIRRVVSFTLEYEISTISNALNKKDAPTPIYVTNSVLSSGTWYKFSIDTTGVFKIDKQFLQNLGINTSSLDPRNIRVYGNGGHLLPQLNSSFRYDDIQENTIFVQGEEDGKFDNEDFIAFYAKGPLSWDMNKNIPLSYHHNNIYSDLAYYFICIDKGAGKRVSSSNVIEEETDVIIESFHDFLVYEKDQVNLFSNGQQWMGEDFSYNNTQSFSFSFDNLNQNENLFVRVRGVAISSKATSLAVNINGSSLMNINFQGITSQSLNLAIPGEHIETYSTTTSNIDVTLNYNNNGDPSARAFLDFIEIMGGKNLIANGNQFSFRNLNTDNSSLTYEYKVSNANHIWQIWEVSDFINPKQILNQSAQSDFSFKSNGSSSAKEFVVINENDFFTPELIDESIVKNQNLHSLKDIEYLIITQDYLISEAERLADYHTTNSNLNSTVVELSQIYNEFGSGSPDLTAIRDFIRFLYLNSSSNEHQLKYVCLLGDASFDFKNRINGNNNIVPAFQSFESFNLARGYVTDDYFGMMDEDEGTLAYFDMQDIAIGRFPITTTLEAKSTIDKTLNYYSPTSFGDWRNMITVVADDPDKPGEFVLQETVDLIAEDIKANKPSFNIKKIYCDAYQQETSAGGERYPQVNTAIDNAVESGTLVVNYFGHGGINGWANERILEVQQIQEWKNPNTLPLFITVTCEFSRFDNPLSLSAGEYTFLNEQGGASNMITTTREIYISVGQVFNKKLSAYLFQFNDENFTISEALMHTKNEFSTDQRFFVYSFGDPAMKLAQAKPNIRITKMNGINIDQSVDTLKALSHIKFEGVVTDNSNSVLTDFNGELSTTIFDKEIEKSTLDNDNFGRTMKFSSIESKIFRGRASVKNGLFSLEFIVPKDIRIAYGKSKLSFYADNQKINKSGNDFNIIIGGIDSNAPQDEIGPEIELFLNDNSFVDGGNTNTSPMLLASLQDDSGINTSITAVDHDIIAILDGDEANPIILNDYYQTEVDDFTSGEVKYQLRNLKSGNHSIKFKCWDTYNNLAEATLNFVVVDNNNLVLSNVLNYPNPFVNYTEFWFNHNKPNEILDTQVQIFTISGKLVKTLNRAVQTNGNLSREITWDGLDDFGNKIGKGVYIYKLKVKSSISNLSAEKIEKLVILQ